VGRRLRSSGHMSRWMERIRSECNESTVSAGDIASIGWVGGWVHPCKRAPRVQTTWRLLTYSVIATVPCDRVICMMRTGDTCRVPSRSLHNRRRSRSPSWRFSTQVVLKRTWRYTRAPFSSPRVWLCWWMANALSKTS
jgi:hypothetical protein